MNNLTFRMACSGLLAALCVLATGTSGAADTDPALASVEETLIVHDIVVSHDPLAETELVADDPVVPSTDDLNKDNIEFLEDPVLAVSNDVNLEVEFVDPTPLPIIREISELNGLPFKRFKDDREGCFYFGVGLDGTVGLHANF